MKLGAHLPAISFTRQTTQVNGDSIEQLVPKRFITPELTATHSLSEKIDIGIYYIYGLGLEKVDQARNTHFLSLRLFFKQIPLAGQFNLNWNPHVYYLNMDGTGGFYVAHALTIGHGKVPLSLGTTMNIKLRSDIPTKDLDWNITLAYHFRNQLIKK